MTKMNRIILDGNKIKTKLDKDIIAVFDHQQELFAINKLTININQNADLIIENRLQKAESLIINVIVESSIKANISIYNCSKAAKIRYQYELLSDCDIKINHYNQVKDIKEQFIIDLVKPNTSVEYILKTIATQPENYSFVVNHLASNTKSIIKTNGISYQEGSILIKIDAKINEKLSNCVCNQYNQIINLNNKKSEIKPNLYIDSYDVEANHSALIGDINQDDIFYITSRGIDYKTAMMLIIKGFMLKETTSFIKEKIDKQINKYWR